MAKKENTKRKKSAAKKPMATKPKVTKKSTGNKALDSVYKGVKEPTLYDKVKAFISKNPVLSIVLVFVVIGGVIVGANQALIYQEKQQFNKAEVALDELANTIVDELGQPESINKEKRCGYSNVKYGKGQLGCGINYEIAYPADASISLDLLHDIAASAGDQPNIVKSNYEFGNIDILTNLELICVLSLDNEDVKTIGFGCSKESLAELYPVID